jgi:hypothetical protein
VTTINQSAFDGCLALAYVEIPASVTTINTNAFNNFGKTASATTIQFDNAYPIVSSTGASSVFARSPANYSTYTVNVYNYTGAAYDADFVAMVAPFTNPVNYIAGSSCFDAATTTVLLAGSGAAKHSYVPITSLAVGNLVQTLRHGARAVKHIGRGRGCNYTPPASAPGWTNWNTNMWKLPATEEAATPLIVTGGHGILFEPDDPALTQKMDRTNRVYLFGEEGVDDPDHVVPSVEGRYLLLAAAYPGATLLPNGFKHDYVHICLDNDGDQDMRYAVFINGGYITETPSEAQFLEHKYDCVDSLPQQPPLLHQDKKIRL